MIVILEGRDGGGKTTLATQLSNIGYDVIRDIRGKFNKQTYMSWSKDDNLHILDRSFISELVYRLLDNDESTMTLSDMLQILNHDAKIVHCMTDSAFEDAMSRGEDNIVDKKQSKYIEQIYMIILSIFQKFESIPVMTYNWQSNSINDVIEFIRR